MVDFTMPTHHNDIAFISHAPAKGLPSSTSDWHVITVFESAVWWTIVSVFILLLLILQFSQRKVLLIDLAVGQLAIALKQRKIV